MPARTYTDSGPAPSRRGSPGAQPTAPSANHPTLNRAVSGRLPFHADTGHPQLTTRPVPVLERLAAAHKDRFLIRLHDELSRTAGITPYRSEANFILFRTVAADRVADGIRQRGILLKNLHGSHPLLDQCLRVTVGTPQENDRFLAALRASL